jgi:hypothetical protein
VFVTPCACGYRVGNLNQAAAHWCGRGRASEATELCISTNTE